MLLWCPHLRSCCSHSHLLLLHLVLQELQLFGVEERGEKQLSELISLQWHKQQQKCIFVVFWADGSNPEPRGHICKAWTLLINKSHKALFKTALNLSIGLQ